MEEEKKQIELQKLKLENEKLEVELMKLKQEVKIGNRFLFLNHDYLKAIGAILLGVPLMFYLYFEITEPALKSAELKSANDLYVDKINFLKEKENLETDRLRIKKDNDSLILKYKSLQKEYLDLIKKFNEKDSLFISMKLGTSYQKIKANINSEINNSYYQFNNLADNSIIKIPVYDANTFQELLNILYLKYLSEKVNAFTFNKEWAILDNNGKQIQKQGNEDNRSLNSAGIKPGVIYNLQILAK